MARRSKGEGSIRLRADGRWEASLPQGKGRGRKYHYARTKVEAQRWLREALRAVEEGGVLPDARQTARGYLLLWLDTVEPLLRPGTFQRHYEIVHKHLIPTLGDVKLARLTPLHVQACYTGMLTHGYAPSTIARVHAVLHKALEDAVRLDLLPRNVSKRAQRPRVGRYSASVFTREQATAFLRAVRGDRHEALYVLALSTGMRLGELLGLQWRDVLVDGGEEPRLVIRRSLQRNRFNGRLYLTSPKTERSVRDLALIPLAVVTLHAQRGRQVEARLRAGPAWRGASSTRSEEDFLFCDEVGDPYPPQNISLALRRLCARHDLPSVRFHDLRHTFTTLLREAGVNLEVVSQLLGHADTGITARVYSHVLPTMREQAVEVLARVLTG